MSREFRRTIPSQNFWTTILQSPRNTLVRSAATCWYWKAFVNRDDVDPDLPAVVDELLRALHSLKGLSGMAGIQAAEKVAHAMEESLRDMKLVGSSPTDNARWRSWPAARVLSSRSSPPAASRNPVRISRSFSPASRLVYRRRNDCGAFSLDSSAELSARGINVNSIRARLQEIGQVRNTTPHIVEGGQITFAFIVASDVADADSPTRQLDGLDGRTSQRVND